MFWGFKLILFLEMNSFPSICIFLQHEDIKEPPCEEFPVLWFLKDFLLWYKFHALGIKFCLMDIPITFLVGKSMQAWMYDLFWLSHLVILHTQPQQHLSLICLLLLSIANFHQDCSYVWIWCMIFWSLKESFTNLTA